MKQFVFQIIALLVVIFAGLLVMYNRDVQQFLVPASNVLTTGPKSTPGTKSQIKIAGKLDFEIEIADSKEERAQGLGGRTNLASNSGMLFIFDTADKHKFWMKGVKFPLDFIWIKGNKVVDLTVGAQPVDPGTPDSSLVIYSPIEPVDKALEVNAGVLREHNIQVGDIVEISRR